MIALDCLLEFVMNWAGYCEKKIMQRKSFKVKHGAGKTSFIIHAVQINTSINL